MTTENTDNSGCIVPANQIALLDALAMGETITGASKRTGLSRRTIYGRLADPEFQEMLSARHQELQDSVRDRITELSATAISVLQDVLTAEATVGYARMSQAALAERVLAGLGILSNSGAKTPRG